MTPPICPYCDAESKLVTGAEIWPDKPSLAENKVYSCPSCDARVGTHSDGRPLGTLANTELRNSRMRAHNKLDQLWKKNYMKRKAVYIALSFHMGIPFKFTHIGLFNEEQCLTATLWAKKELKKYEPNTEHEREGEEENILNSKQFTSLFPIN